MIAVILRCELLRASKDDEAVHVAILRDAAQGAAPQDDGVNVVRP